MTPDRLHDAALNAAVAVVDGVPDGMWDAPTPCALWSVRAVVGHLAWGDRVLAGALRGAAFHEPGGGRSLDLEKPFPDAHRAAVEEVRLALSGPVPDTVLFPNGPLPLADALHIRVQDLVVHCWDIAVATGQPLPVDQALVRAAGRTAADRLAGGTLPPAQFAPPLSPTEDASDLDRLLRTLGRDPRWFRPLP